MSTQELSKAVVLGSLLKIDIGNPNAGWTEGIVMVIKKVERPDGKTHPYISGQALRRYLRDTLEELAIGEDEKMSPAVITSDVKAPIVTEGNPRKYVDDDLFGFMRAIKGETRRRESPLRVSPAFGIFAYAGDRDLGTKSALDAIIEMVKDPKNLKDVAKVLGVKMENKSDEEIKKEITEKALRGSMYETEITNNVFRTTLLLELDRIGKWKAYETIEGGEDELEANDRKKRAILLVKALKYMWGGGRRTRLLIDLTPQFLIYARMTRKVPIFLNNLNVEFKDGRYELNIQPLEEAIEDYKEDIQRLIVGVRKSFITNIDQIERISSVPVAIHSIGEAIDEIQKDIEAASF